MSNDLFLVLILSLTGGTTLLSVWAALRAGRYGGTKPTRTYSYARPSSKMGNADQDLIDKLRRVRWAESKITPPP